MNCAVHPEVEASGYCRNCGKAMCTACVRPVREVLYCEDCLAKVMGIPVPAAAPAEYAGAPAASPSGAALPVLTEKAGNNPGIAFILGLVPGLGAIYNGEYNKALIHIVVFASIIVGLSSDIGAGPTVALALLLAGFIFYMAIDAMRTVKARMAGQPLQDPLESWSKARPIGPMILIGIGALFLLNNFGFFDYFRVRQIFWPAILIGVGFLMLRNRMHDQN